QNKEDKEFLANNNDVATFTYQSVDQNGFAYADKDFVATFTVRAGFNDVTVNGGTVVKAGTTEKFVVSAGADGAASITVKAASATDVNV
ncbi:hypothetical protein SB759_34280, partial [Pseudomonas sp. SIMBA_059]